MEGYMEKLPMNKKKATLLKTWKRRYFKAKDGNVYYYEVSRYVYYYEVSRYAVSRSFSLKWVEIDVMMSE